ncbi:MAG: hypothetical protein QM681_18265 [Novosphingobium sp.]
MADLREKVAKAIAKRNYPGGSEHDIEDMAEGFLLDADVAIAVLLEALDDELPDDITLFRVIRAAGRKDADKANAVLAILPKPAAMLATFREEQLGESASGDTLTP